MAIKSEDVKSFSACSAVTFFQVIVVEFMLNPYNKDVMWGHGWFDNWNTRIIKTCIRIVNTNEYGYQKQFEITI